MDSASSHKGVQSAGTKTIAVLLLITALVTALVARLVWLQILQHGYYATQAVDNSTRVIFLRAPRGIIYDRHGTMIATNKQTLSMVVIPSQLRALVASASSKDSDATAKDPDAETKTSLGDDPKILELTGKLSRILGEPFEDVHQKMLKAMVSQSVLPVVLSTDVPVEVVSKFYEQKLFLPGVDVLPDISRNYPQGELFAHVLGYCGQITDSQLKKRTERHMGDVIGQDGLEDLYDSQLRGVDGEQRVRVNAAGTTLSAETANPVVTADPQAGLPIITSLDVDLQKAAYDALGDRRGAVVAADPQTGEVLAFVSRPSFDPNAFTRKVTPDVWKRLNAPDHPLYNRAMSAFPPGSIWKAISLYAALDKKAVKPDTKLVVSGGLSVGGIFFHDWTSAGGVYDLVKCLAWSRDSAFYQMALRLKPEDIKEWGCALGAGRPTGLELPNEHRGLVPDSEWKKRVYHDIWRQSDTCQMSIGQTFCEVTPAQACRMYSGIGMKGRVPGLHLVVKIGDRQIPAPAPEIIKFNPTYLDVVLRGLKAVVASGTGGATKLGNVEVAGKTGSAEATGGRTHAWFACYAPADKPRIAIAAFVEHGGHGGSAAAPIAKAVLEKFFNVPGAVSAEDVGKAASAAQKAKDAADSGKTKTSAKKHH